MNPFKWNYTKHIVKMCVIGPHPGELFYSDEPSIGVMLELPIRWRWQWRLALATEYQVYVGGNKWIEIKYVRRKYLFFGPRIMTVVALQGSYWDGDIDSIPGRVKPARLAPRLPT